MGRATKNIKVTSDDQLEIPETLLKTKQNFKDASFDYSFDEKDEAYIEYNTLRQKRLETEEIIVAKLARLFDREREKEFIIVTQSSRVRDFNNNYQRCPCTEVLGVVPKPISNISNDAQNRISDIKIIETQNEYTIPFSKSKIIELFESSKDRHKIVCYVGYTRPTRVKSYDIMDNKKIIWNQERFVNAGFRELVDRDEQEQTVLDTRKSYIVPNKIRNVTGSVSGYAPPKSSGSSTRVESLAELVKDLEISPKKKKQNKEEQQEDQERLEKEEEQQVTSQQEEQEQENDPNIDLEQEYKDLTKGE